MELPGGIRIDGRLRQSFRFKALTGQLELAMGEALLEAENHPERVTAVLYAALAKLGGEPPSIERIWELSVGDRQFLMRQLAAYLDDQITWLSATCGSCGEAFDLSFRHAELPVKKAGSSYPETVVATSQGHLRVRVPTGADQAAIATIQDETQALHALLQRLLSVAKGKKSLEIAALSDADISAVEAAAETIAPEVASNLLAKCPHCAMDNQVPIDPYTSLESPLGNLFGEIHTLASNYHWSEEAILQLPRSRRQTYLSLIDHSRGMRPAKSFIEAG